MGRPENKDRETPISWAELIKAEVLNRDRRCAQNMANLCFKFRKAQIKNICGKALISTSIKKGKHQSGTESPFECNQLLTEEYVNQMPSLQQGQKIFKDFRMSPTYWQKKKSEAFALIRQKGKPAFFHSYSIADTKWYDFLVALSLVVDGSNHIRCYQGEF